jgi:hypothetical protein
MKTCSRCKKTKTRSEFYPDHRPGRDLLSHCKECNKEKQRIFREKNGPRVRANEKTIYEKRRWGNHIKRKYGISVNDYDIVLKLQDGKCAICGIDVPGGRSKRFHVDHDHITGEVRGLLCIRCNYMIGYSKNSPDILRNGADYLQSLRQSPSNSSKPRCRS